VRYANFSKLQGCSANKKGVGTHPKNNHCKKLQTHFKAKREKGVGTLFLRVPTRSHPLHLVSCPIALSSQHKEFCKGKKLPGFFAARLMLFWPLIILKYDLFVESA